MKLELTERDIRLLQLACSALIAFFMIRFWLMPGLEQLQQKKMEAEELADTATQMQTTIDMLPLLEQSIAERGSVLEQVSAIYYEKMENRQVDVLLTGLALEHDLFPVSLSISETRTGIPEPYPYGAAVSGDEAVSEQYIQTALGSMVLRGETENLMAFLDTVADEYPALQIRSLRMNEQVYFNAEWDVVMQPDLYCEIAVYMYDPDVVQ